MILLYVVIKSALMLAGCGLPVVKLIYAPSNESYSECMNENCPQLIQYQ